MKLFAISLLAVASVFTGAAHAEKTDLKLVGMQGDHRFFSVSKPWAQDRAYVEDVVVSACQGKKYCFAHIWDKRDGAPTSLPFTDKQAGQVLVSFRSNQKTGVGVVYFNCKKFPDAPKEQCFSGARK